MKKKVLLLLLCLIPSFVLANNGTSVFPVSYAIFMELFVTIHMTAFVLTPLSKMFGGSKSKELFNILFIGRILLLIYFDFFVSPIVAVADFLAVFLGAFIVVPFSSIFAKTPEKNPDEKIIKYNSMKKPKTNKIFVRCSYCGRLAYYEDGTCDSCGASFTEKDILDDWR